MAEGDDRQGGAGTGGEMKEGADHSVGLNGVLMVKPDGPMGR